MTDDAFERVVAAADQYGAAITRDGGRRASIQAPGHSHADRSISLLSVDGAVLMHCHAGEAKEDVLAEWGLTMADLFDNRRDMRFDYSDSRNVTRYIDAKTGKKKFSQGGDTKGKALFHVECLGDAKLVFVVEGETNVLAVEAVGGVAVCNAGGAGKSHLFDYKPLHGLAVVIVADKDEPGRKHAAQIARRLEGIAASVTIVEAAEGCHDVADHLTAGKTLMHDLVAVEVPDPEPEPLTRRVQIPPFPTEAFPEAIAEMISAVAVATQTDPAMAGVSALSALSACTGGHAEIEIRTGWCEPLHVYTVTVAAPGERKSAVQLSMTRPILDVEAELASNSVAATLEAETRKVVATKAAERERNTAASAEGKEAQEKTMADAIGAAMIAESITVPATFRLIADDITPEAAASLIAEQGRLAIISAEAGIFGMMAGRYAANSNLDLWLKSHAGDPLKVDRKGRPPEYIPKPALTLGLMVQPSVLTAIAANREFRGRGLTARILYALPTSKVGHRAIAPPPVDPLIEKAYKTAVGDLATGMTARFGDPAVLKLTETAQQAMTAIETAVEPTLAGNGELASLADWGAKYVGAVARIAGILHLAEHGADAGPRTDVSAVTIRSASQIGAYFKACAINAFVDMGIDVGTLLAMHMLERVKGLGTDEVSERDIQRACKARFTTAAEMAPALDRLVDHGYLIPLPLPEPTGGRPASPRYRVREVRTKGSQGTEGAQ